MPLPVWADYWQLDCCGPTLAIGDSWSTELLVFLETTESSPERSLGWHAIGDGRIELVAEVVDIGSKWGALLDLGSLQLGAPRLEAHGRISSTALVHADWHGGWDLPDAETNPDDITVTGIIRSIQLEPRARAAARAPVRSSAERVDSEDLLIELELLA